MAKNAAQTENPTQDPKTEQAGPGAADTADTAEAFRAMFRTLFPEPGKVVEAAREATLSGLDGTLALQEELQTAWDKGVQTLRKETDAWVDLVQKAARESNGMSYDLTRRSIERFRDEVARFGRAPSA